MPSNLIEAKLNNFNYAWMFDYNQDKVNYCRELRDQYGSANFQFDLQNKIWRMSHPQIAYKIKCQYPETMVPVGLLTEFMKIDSNLVVEASRVERAMELKKASDSDIVIQGIKGDLYPYQRVGVEFLANSNGRAMLFDSPGVGKSLQALSYVLYSNKQKVLVICPASVKYSWENEITKWTEIDCLIIDANTEPSDIVNHSARIFVINYDLLKKFSRQLALIKFDCLIGDEATYFKNSQAQRSKMVIDIARRIPSVIFLTGTPILSRPAEMFNMLHIIDPLHWNNKFAFETKYCNGHKGYWGWDAKGASNLDELKELINKYYLRRTKKDVLKELPPKVYGDKIIKLPPEYQAEYDLAFDEFSTYLEKYKDKDIEDYGSKGAEMLARLSALRQITTNGKIEVAKELIEESVDEDEEKVLVFSCYNRPLLELKEHFGNKAVMIIGSVNERERNDAIYRFQNDPKIKVFLGGMNSAGVGITLTAASTVYFIDQSWSPADHDQAADRVHRPGQVADKVQIFQIYAKGTIDSYMREILHKKDRIFKSIIEDGAPEPYIDSKSFQKEIIKMMKQKKRPV